MGETFGKWELVRRLAAGGMGEVHLARPKGSDAEPAYVLKRVLPHLKFDQELKTLFLQEAGLAARLVHPHVARIHELGDVDGQWFIVMEYVEGKDLDRLLEASRQAHTPLPLGVVVRLVADAAGALDAAHTATDAQGRKIGIIHGDVSPTNFLVSTEGKLKLIDFGIARTVQQVLADDSKALRGKFPYLSPEQVNDEELDARADEFSLGAVAWELLTQRRLFEADSDVQTLDLVAECEVAAPRSFRGELPEALEKVVLRMLAREPAKRFASCAEVAQALEEVGAANGWTCTHQAVAQWFSAVTSVPKETTRRAKALSRAVAEPSSPFVGRGAELQQVVSLLHSGAQVLTLVGPPGRGVSRLAAQALRRGPTRALRVAARGLNDVTALCAELARGLGRLRSTSTSDAPPATVLGVEAALRAAGRLVLMLDEVDALTSEALAVVRRFSDAARDVTILGTAGAPLGWARERVLDVPPLAEADELFRVRAGLDSLDDFERELAARCGGSPVVVEWIAALYGTGAIEVASEALEGDASPGRVREALWDGLAPYQQTALAQLSAIPSTFTLEGAEAVLDLTAFPNAPWSLDVVQGLQELALVETWTLPGLEGEVRFALHEVVRGKAAQARGQDAGSEQRWREWLERQAQAWRALGDAGALTRLFVEGRHLRSA